jgi:hypothetical protein
MNVTDENLPKQKYLWPWIVWPMVLLGITITVVTVWLKVKNIEHQRDFNAPLPSSAPAR